MSSLGYIERYFDPRLVVRDLGSKEWEALQIERVGRALAIVMVAGEMPRRLGGDASREDLALDKKRAKRVGHALRQAFSSWAKNAPELPRDDEIRIAGAQIDWHPFVEDHIVRAKAELIEMATWAMNNDERPWGRSVVTRIENEIKWLEYALRD